MKILHYIPTLSPKDGGTATYMQQLADTLGRTMELHIVTHHTADELEVRHATLHYLHHSTWRYWALRREYLRLLAQIHPDVVHINCCWKPHFAWVAIWAKQAGYRVVLTPHGMLEPWIMRRHYTWLKLPALLLWQRKALRSADLVHVTSKLEQDHLKKIGSYCKLLRDWHPKTRIIANGIDTSHIVMRQSWARSYKLLYMGRIHPKKGLELLFESLGRIEDRLSGFTLQIVGDGDPQYIKRLKQQAQELCPNMKMEWMEGQYGERKWQLLREADLLLLPSHSENFGIIVVEALASGTLVVATQDTPWEELDGEVCGWWVEADSREISWALREFLRLDEDTLLSMGMNGRWVAENRYDTQVTSEDFEDMYDCLCK